MKNIPLKICLKVIAEIFNKKIKVKFIKGNKYSNHYKLTPFKQKKLLAKKILSDETIDFGQGVLDLIEKLEK